VDSYHREMTTVARPLTERQASRIEPLGLLADEPPGLRSAWTKVHEMWAPTLERARSMPRRDLDVRVNTAWSFIETLRHLIFVSDAWIGSVVLENSSPYDPIGLPPDFVTNGAELGLDGHAHPSLAEVLRRRRAREVLLADLLSHVTVDELSRSCTALGGQFTVLGAIQNVVFEEWAHHQYAIRDLNALR
jgi:DinB superfamily